MVAVVPPAAVVVVVPPVAVVKVVVVVPPAALVVVADGQYPVAHPLCPDGIAQVGPDEMLVTVDPQFPDDKYEFKVTVLPKQLKIQLDLAPV